jgi:Ca2+-binding RTX toxin-like protein
MAQVITAGEVVTVHTGGLVVESVLVTGLVGGGYALAWDENIGGGSYIVTARLDANDTFIDLDPSTVGNFRIVNTGDLGSSPSLTATSNGGLVVGFYDPGEPNIYNVARFDSTSFIGLDPIPHDPNGINFYVSSPPQVAGLDGGGYVTAYSGEYNGAADEFDGPIIPIARTLFSSVGNTDISEAATRVRIEGLGDDGYVLAYSGSSGGNGFVKARIISSLAPVDITVNQTATAGTRLDGVTSIAELSNGNFVVIWGNASNKVFARVFEPDGDAVTNELWVDGDTATDHPVSVAALPNGGFAVLWAGVGSPGIQLFDNAGNKVGDPFWDFGGDEDGIINTMTVLATGELMVSYQGGTHGFAQVQKLTVAPISTGASPTNITGTLVWTEGKSGAVGTLAATDTDDTTGFVWSLVDNAGGRFAIDAATGQVTAAKPLLLDFEQAASHSITVKVTDNDGNSFTKVLTATGTDVAKENVTGSAEADKLWGGAKVDKFKGLGGDDAFRGGGGNDELDGGKGKDTADYSDKTKSVEVTLNKSKAATVEVGGKAEDSIKNVENIIGGSKNDTLIGDGASNTFHGGKGKDTLDGKGGKDLFVFDTKLGNKHADIIDGFKAKDDTIVLDHTIFTALAVGPLAADAFVKSKAGDAKDDTDHILYSTKTGKLFYDADGAGGTAKVLFATLADHPKVTAADFEIV